MQFVRTISGSVSKTWNSINPATLSGAIDVIVVEQEDGSLACSPFHVRFGKFSLLRPSEKKVEFKVHGVKQDYSMKLGEGGEAFFVFETSESIPEALQTSPLLSPAGSPEAGPAGAPSTADLSELEPLALSPEDVRTPSRRRSPSDPPANPRLPTLARRAQSDVGEPSPRPSSPEPLQRPLSGEWTGRVHVADPLERSVTDRMRPSHRATRTQSFVEHDPGRPVLRAAAAGPSMARPASPPPGSRMEAIDRAKQKLVGSNIAAEVTDRGDLILDMTGYKSGPEDALRAEVILRRLLEEELEGHYDVGALIGEDERGNLCIYGSHEAKEEAERRAALQHLTSPVVRSTDAVSDPGYQSDDGADAEPAMADARVRRDSDSAVGLGTPPTAPDGAPAGDATRQYAKTLRLSSDQLVALDLRPGANAMSFSVNRATCQAYMYLWKHDVPIVISDIDGTITKSDALGHFMNMFGRDWTHLGVAKLYTDIASNGYNIIYLTSRSVGLADGTRAYLNGVRQEGHALPKGPVIMSPDRTMAALRREVYLRKPEAFKMACLRDIMSLFNHSEGPFYAGFGNRITDAMSYRSVRIPSTRIFTINSNAEVILDVLSLNKYKTGYVSMRELVDQYFPAVGLLVKHGGEGFTDFNYWRNMPLELEDFSDSDSEVDDEDPIADEASMHSEDVASDGTDDDVEDLDASYLSRGSMDEPASLDDSMLEMMESNRGETTSQDEDQEDEDEDDDTPDVTEDEMVADLSVDLDRLAREVAGTGLRSGGEESLQREGPVTASKDLSTTRA